MGHKMVYGIAGSACSNMAALKGAGFIDFHMVVRGGSAPTTNSWFVQTCNDNGTSPIFNNGNDGIPGANGYDYNSYYAQVAALGWHAAGGESEPNAEWKAIMNNMIGMDYGGEWNCCNDLSNIWVHQMSGERVSGHGMAAYLETYVGVCGVYLCHDAVVKAAVACRDAGCKEVGLMIGGWMVNHGIGAQPYIDMINDIESRGVTVSGIVLWWGSGMDMNYVYDVSAQVIKDIQAIWPPEMTTLKNRFGGATPTPTPSGKHIPHIWCGLVGANTNVQVGGTVGTEGRQGWLDTSTNDWATSESLTAAEKAALVIPVLLGARDANGNNTGIATVTPTVDGSFSATIPSPSVAGAVHYNWRGATGNFGAEMAINWTPMPGNPIVHLSAEYTIDHKTGLDKIRGMARDVDNKPSTGRQTGLWSYNEGTKEWKGIAWVRVDSNGYYEYDLTALLPIGSYILTIRTNDGVSLDATQYERK